MTDLARQFRHPRRAAKAALRRVWPNGTPCLVCGSGRTHVTTVSRKRRTYEIRACEACGYLSNFENTVDYTAFDSVNNFKLTTRVGTANHKGREYFMAEMGVDILQRDHLQVMVFGAGRSLDYQHIGMLSQVERVVMSDVVELTSEADFINILEGTEERFDLIIACEVVEHFADPVTEFQRLFDLLTPEGLLVCSTNIYDGGNFAKHTYLYLRGHLSYYSEAAIGVLARNGGLHHDLRTPAIAQGKVGPRKRYVLFTKSDANVRNTATYFADRPYAPSEDETAFEDQAPSFGNGNNGPDGDATRDL
ncbi:methyltransferase domain-containing protein [Aeromicrobium sp.]|uniref:methyltransferase domain-containing protein n=1 Tax=Aeromicrobium sp. TaxID=1871063 RepID=UPI001995ECC0|nr:methyltransferase domain-containing protein [Aeromicrobium sp.]MBC7631406.1 methyltransferase domain-containing protein [Aeromicrobium sp.]